MNKVRRAGKASGFLLATVGSALFGKKPPQPPAGTVTVSDLESYANEVVETGHPPGLSVAVVKDGQTIYQKSFGLADGPRNIATTPDTVFQWMSITKIITAVAILQLQEQGYLDIADPVTKFLPFFAVRYPAGGGEQITLRHLLNHSSGLAHPARMLGQVHFDDQPMPDQVKLTQQIIARNRKLKFSPGTQATYSNLGYTVLGAIVEAVTGRPLHKYVADHIFRPLQMDQSHHIYSDSMRAKAAVGSQPRGSIFSALLAMVVDEPDSFIRETVNGRMWLKRASPDFSGGAGVNGPVVDAARLAAAFLNGGSLNGARILSPESVTMMFEEEHIPAKGGPGSFYKGIKHGLGWFIWPDGHRQRFMHSGDAPGFSAIMQLYPQEGLGIIIMGNEWPYGVSFRGTAIRDSIAQIAADIDWR